MTTTKKSKQDATYAAMRARVDAQIDHEVQAGAVIADRTYEAPRCVLGHVLDGDVCEVCATEKGARR